MSKTYRELLRDYRSKAGLTMTQVGERSLLPRQTIHRAEHPTEAPVKGRTLDVILNMGLGIPRDDKRYKDAVKAWSSEKTEGVETSQPLAGFKRKQIDAALRRLTVEELDCVLRAIENPATRAAVIVMGRK